MNTPTNKYISSLCLKNFQSHKETSLNFSSGINVIVGQSDSGKTAIIRALNWLIWNRPSGDEFISNFISGKEKCIVELKLSDGTVLERIKGKKENIYTLNAQELKAVGQDVPMEISKSLNLSDINIQKQFDSPFLISETSGQIAKIINEISNLEDIDKVNSNINSSIRQEETSLKLLKNQKADLEEQLSKLPNVLKLETKVKTLENFDAILKEKINERSRLSLAINHFSSVMSKYALKQKIYDRLFDIGGRLNYLIEAKETLKNNDLKYTSLLRLILEAKKTNNLFLERARLFSALPSSKNILNQIEKQKEEFLLLKTQKTALDKLFLNGSKIASKIAYKQGLYLSIQNIRDKLHCLIEAKETAKETILKRNVLSRIINENKIFETRFKKCQEQILILKDKLDKMLPNICPICGAVLK